MTSMSFYSPLKPIDSPIPSGDREISRGLFRFFETHGVKPFVVSRLVSRRAKFESKLTEKIQWSFKLLPNLLKSVTQSSDILFTYHNYYKAPDWIHPVVSWLKGTPYVVFEASFKPSLKDSDPLAYHFLKFSFKQAKLLFTDTKRDFEVLKKHFPEKTHYVRPSIEDERILDSNQVGDMNGTPQLVSIAMLRADRKFPSVKWLVETLSELQNEGYRFHYRHIGGGECFEELENLCHKLLKPENYTLCGTLEKEETMEQLQECDIFVYPGIGETFGMVYLEAQAKGLPVVAFKNGGVADAIADGTSGHLCQSFDREEYKQRIIELISDREKYASFSRGAVEYVSKFHSQTKNYKEMLTLIQQTTGLSC